MSQSSRKEAEEDDVPKWINASFFQNAIRKSRRDCSINIVEFEVKQATAKGENMISKVYRARVKEEGGIEHHLIVKCLPWNEARKTFANRAKFFEKEINMYEIIFPTYQELYGDVTTSLPWPNYYFSFRDGNCDYLILKDLKSEGFVLRERQKGLDAIHLEMALAVLGKFHAHSYALKVKDPEAFHRKVVVLYPETMFNEDIKELFETHIKTSYLFAAEAVREWGGPRNKRIAEIMEATAVTAFDDMCRLLEPVEPGAVLTHGDLWVNNILYKYSKQEEAETGLGKPIDVKLLDFQIARYSSPASDLMYLMTTSTTAKTRREHWDKLLEHAYLRSFWDTMEALGQKGNVQDGVFTTDWLKKEVKRFLPFAFMCSVSVCAIVLADSGDFPDLDTMPEDKPDATDPFKNLAKGKLFQERLRDLLDEFEEDGFLDLNGNPRRCDIE